MKLWKSLHQKSAIEPLRCSGRRVLWHSSFARQCHAEQESCEAAVEDGNFTRFFRISPARDRYTLKQKPSPSRRSPAPCGSTISAEKQNPEVHKISNLVFAFIPRKT